MRLLLRFHSDAHDRGHHRLERSPHRPTQQGDRTPPQGEITLKTAADEMEVSTTTVRKLIRHHRSDRPDPVEFRRTMVGRLATEHGAATYGKSKRKLKRMIEAF